MTAKRTSFSFIKRNFLHSKLDELIHLWHRASGQGSFLFSVDSDGQTNFQFGIQLEFEEDKTHHTGARQSAHDAIQPQQHHHQGIHGGARQRGRGPAKQARDRARAAQFQAAQAAKAADTNASNSDAFPVNMKVLKPEIILPFTGKLLSVQQSNIPPVKVQNEAHDVSSDCDQIAVPAVSSFAATVTSSSSLATITPPANSVPAALPAGKSFKDQNYFNVDEAKKQLFPTDFLPTQPSPSTPPDRPHGKRSYKKKEEDLWSKLFQ